MELRIIVTGRSCELLCGLDQPCYDDEQHS